MRRASLDDAELARRYAAGESERALAAAFGCARDTVRKHLDRMDVPRRGLAEASAARWQRMSPAERRTFTAAARTATLGRTQSEEHLARTARAREIRGAGRTPSTAVMILARALQARGLAVRHNRAVGRYSGDLVVGSVVVEVLGRATGASKHDGARLRYLMDRGYTVFYLWVDDRHAVTLAPPAIQLVVRTVDTARRRPSEVPTFTVLHHTGRIIEHGLRMNAEFDRIPRLPRNNP